MIARDRRSVFGAGRPAAHRSAITLMEVLISIFVLLFGLMGVAAIFPVGNHYVVEGEKFDQASILAQNAFEELQARGMLRPESWVYYSDELATDAANGGKEFIGPINTPNYNLFNIPMPAVRVTNAPGPGHAFVIDPLGAANSDEVHFPWEGDAAGNPWLNPPAPQLPLAGDSWPVRRFSLPVPDPTNTLPYIPMTTPVAETIFRLRDDLSVELPERDDAPGIQRWNVDGTGNLLTRQYIGNFSWLATIVPHTNEALLALQPAHPASAGYLYDVSVVVFYKRDTTPSELSERLLPAEMNGDGEVVFYDPNNNPSAMDKTFEDIKAGDWIALMGVNQNSGAFTMKWYRLLALDEDSQPDEVTPSGINNVVLRRAMLTGPDWPQTRLPGGNLQTFEPNLRAAILPGVASVVTREMTLEKDSPWSGE